MVPCDLCADLLAAARAEAVERVFVMAQAVDVAEAFEKIEYRLEERGYPGVPADGIQAVCRELKTGQELAQLFSDGAD
ncbi:hypothetical protein [Magnetospirillum sp. SS-4]|uniref:hypothetical protein n=1 Tax=Magnetospirillum sp. SS-4 TaxID=2681465 RepID=UPI001574E852|nr:hypothetical protein [Magnetospirillum sp. SS-4]